MILQCPECNARYAVPDSAIGVNGRDVRCAKCHHSWHQAGITAEAQANLDDVLNSINATTETSAEEEQTPRKRPRRNLPVVRKKSFRPGFRTFSASVSVMALGMLLLVVYPAVYGQPRSSGLAIGDAGMVKIAEDKKLAFDLSGKIVNTTEKPRKVPTLRISLIDDKGEKLQFWDFTSPGTVIDPGKSVPFTTGKLPINFSKATRFVMELGTPLELMLRRKAQ